MTNSRKNVINPFLESSTLLIVTFPEIVESKDRFWGRTCAVDNVRARRKGVRGKLYEIQISPERGLRNSLRFPRYFGMKICSALESGQEIARMLAVFCESEHKFIAHVFLDLFGPHRYWDGIVTASISGNACLRPTRAKVGISEPYFTGHFLVEKRSVFKHMLRMLTACLERK